VDTGEIAPIPWPNIAGRTKVLTYTVQSGDSLWSIANQFELDLDTLRWSNIELERNPDVLSVGTELIILPVNGAYHIVKDEDTLESIAALYGISETDIIAYPPNGMYPPYELEVGQGLIIPFGNKEKELPKPSISADYALAWPMVTQVTGTFSPDHTGIDLGAYYGAMVYAAHGGIVIATDWTEIYGYRVILDHGNGLQTWYAHLKGTPLTNGLAVPRGTPVGEVGSTGRSTGPHLHFEVRLNGEPVNPLGYLPETPQ
jgi:murein DD-endopeptidase MepM/ murein hydrolase activator NlpD